MCPSSSSESKYGATLSADGFLPSAPNVPAPLPKPDPGASDQHGKDAHKRGSRLRKYVFQLCERYIRETSTWRSHSITQAWVCDSRHCVKQQTPSAEPPLRRTRIAASTLRLRQCKGPTPHCGHFRGSRRRCPTCRSARAQHNGRCLPGSEVLVLSAGVGQGRVAHDLE